MTDYTIPKDTPDWDVPLNANLTDIDNRLSAREGQTFYLLVASASAPANVRAKADYVCDGIADQVEIQAAVDAAFTQNGGIVQLSTGAFNTTAPITLHPAVTIQGTHGDQIFNPSQLTAGSYIAIQPSFSGGAAIVMLGQTAGGYTGKSADQRIFNLTINGDSAPAGIHGIQASDYVHGVVMRDVAVVRVTGKGIYTFTENGAQPFSWTFHRVLVDNAGGVGVHLINHTDCTAVDMISIGAGSDNFTLSNMPNSRFTACRAEWSDNGHGFKLEGNFGTGAGSGGMTFTGCSTDRNHSNGFDITTTGNAPIVLTGCMTRRDGRNNNSGGGGFSGINAVAATTPIVITGWSQYPGQDDNATGVLSPQVGGTFTNNTSVQIANSYIHGFTTALTQSGNTTFIQDASVIYATGDTAAPVRSVVSQAFNVKKYGAVGDGVADDTAAIQAAITAIGSAGGVLFFPAGAYLLNGSSPINLPNSIHVKGEGPGSTSIRVGSSFTGSAAITVSQSDCTIQDIMIRGANTTVTSNPVCDGINSTGNQSFKMFNVVVQYINGYGVKAFASSSSTIHGGQFDNVKVQSCAGGIYIKGDNASGNTAANFQMSNIFTRFLGVTTGGSANLDGIRIEDAWDVLVENCFAWMNATTGGTGIAFRVVGNCAATFVMNLDALGPQTGAANVSIEANANGSPQNVQITGGVIQQGLVGLRVSDAATQVRVASVRFINNQTHGAVISTSGPAVYLDSVFFSGNGAGATGTNYDLNWSGTSTGFVTNCRFASPIVAVSSAGVQQSVNITAGQNVRFWGADFQGTGAAQANWFTNLPAAAHTVTGGNFAFLTNTDFNYSTGPGRISIQPFAAGNNCLSLNVQGTDANDRFRLTGDGKIAIGPGTATRDTSWGRQGVAQIGTADSDIVVGLAGKGLIIKGGTNAKAGTVTANGTTAVTVATTAVTANSTIVISYASGTTNTTAPYVSALTPGTSFQIKSAASDVCVYNWAIIERN